MLQREVGHARPTSVAEAIGLLAENDGAGARGGGQTLVAAGGGVRLADLPMRIYDGTERRR